MIQRIISAILACASTATLVACIPAISEGTPPGGVAAAPAGDAGASEQARIVTGDADIAGQWDIVSFDGYTVTRRSAGTDRMAFADFGNGQVALRIECNYTGVAGGISEGRFVSRPSERISTLIGCGPERHARDDALTRFFDRRPLGEILADGRLRFTAGDTVLLLQRPEQRRLSFLPSPAQVMGEWRLDQLARYESQGGMAGIGLSETPGRVTIDGMQIRYTRCPGYGLRYRYTREGRLEKTEGASLPAALPADCGILKNPNPTTRLPEPYDVLRVLHGNPTVELVDDATLLLVAGELRLVLTKAPCERMDQSDDHATTTITDCAAPL